MTPVLRPKRCRCCKEPFMPARPMQVACGLPCAQVLAKKINERRQAAQKRAERKADSEKRQKMKSRRKWLAECQVLVNKYCRLRDLLAGCGCISCGSKPAQAFGGTMDAGHYRSVGSAPHLRFYTLQIALQCVKCNRNLGGNAVEMRRGLVARYGAARVEQIEAMQGTAKWTVEYLMRLKRVMAKKVNRMEKRMKETA